MRDRIKKAVDVVLTELEQCNAPILSQTIGTLLAAAIGKRSMNFVVMVLDDDTAYTYSDLRPEEARAKIASYIQRGHMH